MRPGISIRFLNNFEDEFAKLPTRPILVNDFDLTLLEDRERFQSLMYTRYGDDLLSPIASCKCGEIEGQTRLGIRCHECDTVCEVPVDRQMEVSVWMEAPEGMKFIHPVLLIMLSRATRLPPYFDTMRWLLDPFYIPRVKSSPAIDKFIALGIPRGMKNFTDNFDQIIEVLRENRIISTRLVTETNPIIPLIHKYRSSLLTSYLPLPDSRNLVVNTLVTVQSETDAPLLSVIDAAGYMASISKSDIPMTQAQIDSRMAKAMFLMADYYERYLHNHIRDQTAWPRKHIYGTALGYTSRVVITSLTGNHHYQELQYPWGASVALLEEHLSGMLLRRGYTPNQITEIVSTAAMTWCPIVDELFNEMLANAPKIPGTDIRGLPCTFQRPPSLYRGSTQLFYISRIGRDPNISSAAMSPLTLRAPNADFDGDEMQLTLLLDEMQLEYFSRLEPHLYVLDIARYRKVSGHMKFQGPVMSTLSNWLSHVE